MRMHLAKQRRVNSMGRLAKWLVCLAILSVAFAFLVLYLSGFTTQQMKVAFTFDDGTVDGYTVAAPILEKYGYRGVFSVINDCIGKRGYMSLDQIRDLAARGHTIASHTLSHADIGTLCRKGDFERARYQIEQSKASFERDGIKVQYLTFPHGNNNEKAIEIVRECGMQPLVIDRPDFGGGGGYANPMLNVGDYLSAMARSHLYDQCVLMFHVVNDGVGYGAYGDNGQKFEQIVRNVREMSMGGGGGYVVVNYPTNTWTVECTCSLRHRLKTKLRKLIRSCAR